MSFAVSSLQVALGVPSTRVPIGVTTFVTYVAPPLLCYIVFAVLAITPQTRSVRVALWPVVALLAFRAAVSVDISHGNIERKFLDTQLLSFMLTISFHSLSWTWAQKPLVRHLRPANSSPSTIMDALDLITNFRGHGWDWSRGSYVPRETRPTNRIVFAFYALLSVVANALICGGLHRAIHTFTEDAGSSPVVSTIFDETLPFFVRYLRASIITVLAAYTAYTGMQLNYSLLTTLGILLFGQDPAQWPPAFDSPWRATSLSDFWGRRWHQFYRFMFQTATYPFSVVFGRAGGVIGAFLASALFHHLHMITFNRQSEIWRMLVGFGIMGPGILAERQFYKFTGRKVGGVAGWIWTMTWILLWGNVMADGLLRSGMFSQPSAIDNELSVWVLLEKLVRDFNAWLHTI